MKKRILRNLKLNAIAAVDRPCQEGARMAIIKRESEMHITKTEHDAAIAKLTGEHKTALDAVNKTLADLQLELAKSKLNDDERAYFDKMTDEAQRKAFCEMSEEDRKKKMGVKKVENDEQITIGNTVVLKSAVGDTMFAALKAQQLLIDESAKLVKSANDKAEEAMISKRVEIEFAHVAGTPQEKHALLKSVQSASPEAKAALDKIMKSAEDLAKGAFVMLGANGDKIEIAKARETFMEKVHEIKKREKCTQLEALRKARNEHPDLYDAMNEAGEKSQEDEAA